MRVQCRAVVGGVHFCIVEAWESLLCKMSGSGRRAASGICGRSVGAEPMTGGVVCVVDARGLAEERGLGDGLHILHELYLNSIYSVKSLGIPGNPTPTL